MKIYFQERRQYINLEQEKDQAERQLTADEMSEFYKQFLDKNWKLHLDYNVQWYKINFTLLYLSLRVCIEKIIFRSF